MIKVLLLLAALITLSVMILTKKSPAPDISFSPGQIISPSATPTPQAIPPRLTLVNNYHIFQAFNNCGPASLSMALSYYEIAVSQEELGSALRPYQIQGGDNDDKSVTLEELAEKAQEYGLTAYHRPLGDIELLKQFVANGIPVITRTWTKVNEDIGHYRVIKGYDDTTGIIIQDDSLDGKNLQFSYTEFNELWGKFNYEYLVLVPEAKLQIAGRILGANVNKEIAWQNAVSFTQKKLADNPDDITTIFNLSVAYTNTKEYQKAVETYEKVRDHLPARTLWYQLEPVEAYYRTGDYNSVFEITEKIFASQNKAYSEAYLLRGQSYLKLGQVELAKEEFNKAVFYNRNFANKIPTN
jgi:tetratricopeptide (TPR) repeat protein